MQVEEARRGLFFGTVRALLGYYRSCLSALPESPNMNASPPTLFAESIYFPGRDGGMAYIGAPCDPIAPWRSARVRQIPASEAHEVNLKLRRRIDAKWRWPKFPPVFETGSQLVEARNVKITKSRVMIGKKTLLSAAAGDRVWMRNLWNAIFYPDSP